MTEKEDDVPAEAAAYPNTADYEEAVAVSLRNSLQSLTSIEGAQTNGPMSVERRNFCLFVFFDFLVVSFIWLMLAMLSNQGDFKKIVSNEIIHCTIEKSTFDLVTCAFVRFALLGLFYGILRMKSWILSAFSTSSSCIFLIFKVVYFDWNDSNQTVLQGTLFLVSFIICWIELWLMVSRVLPKEQFILEAFRRNDVNQQIAHEVVNENLRRTRALVSGAENPSQFYTPIDSNNVSDDENCDNIEESEWMKIADAAVAQMAHIIESQNWALVQRGTGCQVSSSTFQNKQYFKIEMLARAPIDRVKAVVLENAESIKTWNKMLEECSRVTKLSCDNYDIQYQVTKRMIGVSQRDMVIVRRSGQIGNFQTVCFASIQHPDFPPRHEIIRAEFSPSGWAIREHVLVAGLCEIVGYISLDLKLPFPKAMVTSTFAKSLLDLASGIHDLTEID